MSKNPKINPRVVLPESPRKIFLKKNNFKLNKIKTKIEEIKKITISISFKLPSRYE